MGRVEANEKGSDEGSEKRDRWTSHVRKEREEIIQEKERVRGTLKSMVSSS